MVRLSELLRYALYETKNPTISLSQDVSSLKNYIELEKIRLEDNLEFRLQSNVPENCRFEITPLLLVVFVENAFKHAKKVQNQVIRIEINMHLSDDGLFVLQAENNCLPNAADSPGPSNGIGLKNVKKRLDVLYPNDLQQLNIEKTAPFFGHRHAQFQRHGDGQIEQRSFPGDRAVNPVLRSDEKLHQNHPTRRVHVLSIDFDFQIGRRSGAVERPVFTGASLVFGFQKTFGRHRCELCDGRKTQNPHRHFTQTRGFCGFGCFVSRPYFTGKQTGVISNARQAYLFSTHDFNRGTSIHLLMRTVLTVFMGAGL